MAEPDVRLREMTELEIDLGNMGPEQALAYIQRALSPLVDKGKLKTEKGVQVSFDDASKDTGSRETVLGFLQETLGLSVKVCGRDVGPRDGGC